MPSGKADRPSDQAVSNLDPVVHPSVGGGNHHPKSSARYLRVDPDHDFSSPRSVDARDLFNQRTVSFCTVRTRCRGTKARYRIDRRSHRQLRSDGVYVRDIGSHRFPSGVPMHPKDSRTLDSARSSTFLYAEASGPDEQPTDRFIGRVRSSFIRRARGSVRLSQIGVIRPLGRLAFPSDVCSCTDRHRDRKSDVQMDKRQLDVRADRPSTVEPIPLAHRRSDQTRPRMLVRLFPSDPDCSLASTF